MSKSIAEKWVGRLDDNSSPSAVTKATDAAVDVMERFGEYHYIYEDGSSIYEKRRGDWYPGSDYIQCPECSQWHDADKSCSDCATISC